MNSIVASYIKQQLETLTFSDRVGGITRVVSITNGNGNGAVSRFPISCEVSHRDCISSKQHHLVPDSKLKSLMYFEDGGATVSGKTARGLKFSGQITLVCWLNLNRLGQTSCDASAYAMAEVVKLLNGINNVNVSPLNTISVSTIAISPKTASIFSKYSYNEAQNQYLLFPYDYFALNLTVTYEMPFACINDNWINTEIECTDNSPT